MDLRLNPKIVEGYKSESQKIRVLTEDWFANNMFCPRCGAPRLEHFDNNKPVADFYCPKCRNQFELKSKAGAFGRKIVDGAYDTMIERIMGKDNPDFFVLNYSKSEKVVSNLLFIPKQFFVPQIIERRKPLSETARRAGWVGCNILLKEIPEQGRINIIKNGVVCSQESVVFEVNKSNGLMCPDIDTRGWLLDVLWCIEKIPTLEFSLYDVYKFEKIMAEKHPNNNNIRPKIRQKLQRLRDINMISFLGNGRYRKEF